jgi:hypothetical protein
MNIPDRGLDYIAKMQQPDGSFVCFSSPSKRPFVQKTTYVTTFAQAIMLAALAQVKSEKACRVRSRLADWLLEQRSPYWSFNYWPRNHELSKQLPYPDDLDDTFCALTALYQHDPRLVDATCLAGVAKLLIATEAEVGGPYRTWLVPPDSDAVWTDVDVAVNSNIAGFLQLVAGPLPNLTALMERAIADKKLTSSYYPSAYPVAYYVARAYRGPQAERLAEDLLKRARQGFWGTPLQTALAVSALVHLGRAEACEPAVRYLQSSQQENGSWPAEAFCIDPAQGGQTFYSGSSALTTALVLEALAGAEAARPCADLKTGIAGQEHDRRPLNSQIYRLARDEFRRLPEPLASACGQVSRSMQKVDSHHEITLLPAFFASALKACPAWVDEQRLLRLGQTNLYGWMAYTLFDTVIDEKSGMELLPAASAALRRCQAGFWACLPGDAAFQQLVEQTFDVIDAANTWEAANCRFKVTRSHITVAALPRYGRRHKLAERSLGHALTLLAILTAEGYALQCAEIKNLHLGFTHYLIARQLCDDLHDWEQDLRQGRVTYVVAELLRSMRVKPGRHDLRDLLPLAQRRFWHHAVRPLCDTALNHLVIARRAYAASNLFTAKNEFFDLLDRLEAGLQKTLDEQAAAVDFLHAYSKEG